MEKDNPHLTFGKVCANMQMNVSLVTRPEIGLGTNQSPCTTKGNRKVNARCKKMLGHLQKTGGYQQIADPKRECGQMGL